MSQNCGKSRLLNRLLVDRPDLVGLSSPAVFIDAREPKNAIESAAGLKAALLDQFVSFEKTKEAWRMLTPDVPDAVSRVAMVLASWPSKVELKSTSVKVDLKALVPADAGLEDVLKYVESRLADMRPGGLGDSKGPWPVGTNGRPSLAPLRFSCVTFESSSEPCGIKK